MYCKILILLLLLHLAPARVKAQLREVSFAKLDSLQKSEGRSVIVFLGADWCNWCGAMKHTTFKDPEVVHLLNTRYYFIQFNTEEKGTVTFKGRRFGFKELGRNTGRHELADELGTGTLPAICVLNKENQIIYQYAGYLSPKDFYQLLQAIDNGSLTGK